MLVVLTAGGAGLLWLALWRWQMEPRWAWALAAAAAAGAGGLVFLYFHIGLALRAARRLRVPAFLLRRGWGRPGWLRPMLRGALIFKKTSRRVRT